MNDRYNDPRRVTTLISDQVQMILNTMAFDANNPNTWHTVIALTDKLLTELWQEGGLQGSTAAQAFQVQCGLGSSMTQQDIDAGRLVVVSKVAITHPFEFIVIENQVQLSISS